ncbi:MAG: hypothetical protein WC943_00730 [Elusimicrobiota bacterium]|jgi:hypothetical protein
MKIQLSAAFVMLSVLALSSEAATTRAVQKSGGTFRAVSVQGNGSAASPSSASSYRAPATVVVSQPVSASQPGRAFAPVGTGFTGGSGRRSSGSANRFQAFRTSWSLRKAADPEPAPDQGPQPSAGALILTAGSGYTVQPGGAVAVHSVDGGSQFIEHTVGGQAIEGQGHRVVPYDPRDHGASGSSSGSTVESPLGSALSK